MRDVSVICLPCPALPCPASPCLTLPCRALPCSALRDAALLCAVLSPLESFTVLQEHCFCALRAKAVGLSCSAMCCLALVLCCAQSLLLFALAQKKAFSPCCFLAQNTKRFMVSLATMRLWLVSALLGRILVLACFLLGCILVVSGLRRG